MEIDIERLEIELKECSALLEMLGNSSNQFAADTIRTAALSYQKTVSSYALLETFYPNLPLTREALRIVQVGRRVLYGKRFERAKVPTRKFAYFKRLRDSFGKVALYCYLAIAIGSASALVTALMVLIHPDFGWNFLNEKAIVDLREGRLWTEGVRGMSAISSSQIARNNIQVSLLAFAVGMAGGFLTVLILILNGAMLGGIFAFLSYFQMSWPLFDFVIAHGVLELSIIAVCAGCGLAIGDALIHPGEATRLQAMKLVARPALDVVIFSVLCLLIAGFVEGYVSPYAEIPFTIKLTLGLILGAAYWASLLLRIDRAAK